MPPAIMKRCIARAMAPLRESRRLCAHSDM
jgi:hypothetical protein